MVRKRVKSNRRNHGERAPKGGDRQIGQPGDELPRERRLGNAHPNIVPYQSFAARDGHLIVAVGNNGQFARLCAVLALERLTEDERFGTNAGRVRHRSAIVPPLAEAIARRERDELLGALREARVPAGPINGVAEVFADAQFVHRAMRIEPDGIPGLRTPIRFAEACLALERRAPGLGEHDEELRGERGRGDSAAS